VTEVAELLERVWEKGAEVRLGGPTGVEVVHYRRLDSKTLAQLRRARVEVRRALQAANLAAAIVAAQRLLRECGFPRETVPCLFHRGLCERCDNCGANWREHLLPAAE
jgi:hypothetical protein